MVHEPTPYTATAGLCRPLVSVLGLKSQSRSGTNLPLGLQTNMTRTVYYVFVALAFANSAASLRAQKVFIPDPALNAAARETLPKPTGPRTVPDMPGLILLSAGGRTDPGL